MKIILFLICAVCTNSLYLDGTSLMELLNLSESTLHHLDFEEKLSKNPKCKRIADPFLTENLPMKTEGGKCDKIGIINDKELSHRNFSSYPEFQAIFRNCQITYPKNSTCLAMCIFQGIINRKEYGHNFFIDLKNVQLAYFNESESFPHLSVHDFHVHGNIFCLSKEHRRAILKHFNSCKLQSSLEVCVIDEEKLLCDSKIGNCDYDESQVSAITIENQAHLLTCGPLNSINWKYFDNSSKLQCFLPRKDRLSNTERALFKNCEICDPKKSRKYNPIIEFLTPPTKEEFLKVANSSLPILIRNVVNFKGELALNFSFLKQIYKDHGKMNCEYNAFFTRFKNFEDALFSISDDVEWNQENIWYIRWQLCDKDIQNKFQALIPKLNFLPDDYQTFFDPYIYAGSPGDGVPPHVDYIKLPSCQFQLSGTKRWFLRAPPECSHICTKWIPVKVYQGDLFIFEASKWTHGTIVENGDLSIAISTGLDFPRDG